MPLQPPRVPRSGAAARLGAAVAVASAVAAGLGPVPGARAGLLLPVLQLMRPQLESKLTELCVNHAANGNAELRRSLQDPCHQLSIPTSRCLIEETDSSGRGLGVVRELLAGRFGEDSELVVKRCLARLFGLPADSLREMPLRQLARRFGSLQPGPESP